MAKKSGFFEWLLVKESPDTIDPESTVPTVLWTKPPPPRRRTRRRYEKSTQTEFRKSFPQKSTVTRSVQASVPLPPPHDGVYLVFVFISGIMVGIMLKKWR